MQHTDLNAANNKRLFLQKHTHTINSKPFLLLLYSICGIWQTYTPSGLATYLPQPGHNSDREPIKTGIQGVVYGNEADWYCHFLFVVSTVNAYFKLGYSTVNFWVGCDLYWCQGWPLIDIFAQHPLCLVFRIRKWQHFFGVSILRLRHLW